MKYFYFFLISLGFSFFISAQNMGGTPVQGLIPIKRISSSAETNLNSTSKISGTAKLSATTTTPTGNSPEVGITEGQLSVSLSGGANYSIPVAVPPGINGVVPQVSLSYNSQGGNGVAGYGWNISGVSAITRIPRTKFHDGIVGGVNLDTNDRFAFDGQRLILKSGNVYGEAGAIYETESFSNIKISSQGTSSSDPNPSFKVEYPDGSVAMYGASLDSRSITTWGITYWENPQGVRISYNYILANNNMSIEYIKYGTTGTNTAINQIQFVYVARQRPEQSYIGGQSILMNTILKEIKTIGNGIGFRNYVLEPVQTSLGYERLERITEKSGDNTKSYNPTVFSYGFTNGEFTDANITTSLSVGNITSLNAGTVSGDFDGDEKMEFLLYPTTGTSSKTKYWFFNDIHSGNNINMGYEHNVGAFETIFPVSWLTWTNKLWTKQGWAVAKKTDTNYTFTVYCAGTVNPIYYQYDRVVNFPTQTVGSYGENCRNVEFETIFPKKILSGDFNGDGLTDVIAIDLELQSFSYSDDYYYGCISATEIITSKKVYFVDLKRDNTSNFLTYSGELAADITSHSRVEVADVNGDGKSDFLIFENGKVTTYTLNSTNQLVLLWNYLDANISIDTSKTILLGDYNGDGKTDFITPKGYGYAEWYKYSSTGITFSKEIKYYDQVNFNQNTTSNTYNYIISDYNKDGKSDLIMTDTSLNTDKTKGWVYVKCYINKNGNFDGTWNPDKPNTASTYSDLSSDITLNTLPIYLPTGRGVPNKYKPYSPTLEIAFLSNNKVFYINSNKDNAKDQLLLTITTGNGVRESITYKPLIYEPCPYNCNSVYSNSVYIENYPNTDIESASTVQVVSQLEKQSATVYKKQLFSYAGATSNLEGLGYFGFRASMRTNWFENDSQIISSISKFDPNLRGANVENYTYLGLVAPTIAVNATTPTTGIPNSITLSDYTFTTSDTRIATGSIIIRPGQNGTSIKPTTGTAFVAKILPNYDSTGFAETNTTAPVGLITKSLSSYEVNLSPNKVYKLQGVQSKNYNILDNTSSETNTSYDTYNNPIESITKLKNGGIDEQTTTSTVAYASPTATPYIIGSPTSKIQTVISSGDSMTSKETYGYGTGTESNLLKVIQKWGNNTSGITEANVYDAFGNITQKTISAAGITDRKTNYKYDPTGRFLIESNDIETLKTTYLYNPDGTLKSKTNPYNLTTSYLYDPWFKKTTTTDYLSKTNTLAYIRQNEKTLITSTGGDDGSYSEELYDDLGRKMRTGIKDLQNNMSYKDFKYDIYDRNFSVSEPYTGSPSLWNTTSYDIYGRPETATDFRNKVISMVYDKLTTTATDGSTGITEKSTKNAMGNVVQMEETPGGIINYSYFANGKLKETNYAGTKITLTQDGWGRKTSLADPAAGTYTYEYNALGEMTKETTPNGTTTYNLDAWGKPSSKTIVGLNTDSNTVYTYNALADGKLLIKTQYTDAKDASKKNTTDYTYDQINKRLLTTKETTDYGAVFTKTLTYDAWGRVDTETSEASLNGKSSKTIIQNEYKNGFAYKIKDVQNPKTLWETNEVNARGQLTKATLGNGIVIDNTYDSSGFGYLTNTKHTLSTTATTVMELTNDFDFLRGNVNWRKNSLFGNVQENFGYDNQDRLITYPNALGAIETQTYEVDGRILTNKLGTYNYTNTQKKYQNTSVTLSPEATGYYANREGVFSDSMEDKKGWTIPDPLVYTYDTTEKHLGNTSIKIANTNTSEKVIHSEVWTKIDNTTPTSYTYSAWVKSDAPQAELFLFMKTETETNYFTLVDSKVTDVKNQWTRIEGTFVVPANIKKLNLRLDNNGLGNVWFDDVMIRKTSNTALVNLQVPNETYKDRQLGITYNTFKSPIEISEAGVDKISFVYNDNNSRSVMFYGSLDVDKNLRPNRKYYSADGSMEIKQNILTGVIEFVTYLGGNGYSAPVVYKKTYESAGASQEQILYLHRDYQGSILAITNEAGAVLEKRQFDAWGAIIKVLDGNGNILNGLIILDRGYTGHEHLQSVGLINMNGRLYDPKLHRFLQPDNYVQDLYNTQNYNRYGYVLNNPLKYTDPSGELSFKSIGRWFKRNLNDIVAGVQIVVGVILTVTGLPEFGVPLILAGVSHFAAAYNEYKQTGDWASASNNAGVFFNVSFKIDWGYDSSKNDKNGVTQTAPVVTPKTVEQVKQDKGENSFHPGQYLPNFKSDIGFDFFKFKGLHYGVPEFESSWITGAAFTPGPFVIYPTGGSSRETYNTHEPGHVIQFALLGRFYYPFIALPSILHVNDPNTNYHYHELTANQLWYWWSGESFLLNPRHKK
ncbi:RHS repeat-associated core domain-containing protein [Flavobacterium sp.]|uniref:RHS repeat-associated core domain-containing protein n=1 Tax=Flavobacterium sp. TaxID=239 RepID=UPI00286CDC64|nr:RHS repeat-associated core domain-containing protein [Flavobacterium sp.]